MVLLPLCPANSDDGNVSPLIGSGEDSAALHHGIAKGFGELKKTSGSVYLLQIVSSSEPFSLED
jgi:hypothetical protein